MLIDLNVNDMWSWNFLLS